MKHELDALLIRSLPELNDAVHRLIALDEQIGREIETEIQAWIRRNGWMGIAERKGESEDTWLAPKDWMVPNDPDENAYLYFGVGYTSADPEDNWDLATFTSSGHQRLGFWLRSNTVKDRVFKNLWKTQLGKTSALPLHGPEFFLPMELDREALAVAVLNGSVADALDPLRETLDRLPELASQLDSLKMVVVAAAGEGDTGAADRTA